MIKKTDIEEVVSQQQARLVEKDIGYPRDLLNKLPGNLPNHALIISGIRRCGKSTLLHQLWSGHSKDTFYFNFDTPRLYNFELSDFELLDKIIAHTEKKYLFFDEIQVVSGWELYVRQKLDEGYRLVITGSNASLLSRELGTKLTGRHISKELFPFSYHEYCAFLNLDANEDSLSQYLVTGGFPEFVKTQNFDILTALIDDIVHRDIAVRHHIRDVKPLKQLLVYLASNVGNLVTASKLTQSLRIKSAATVLEYFTFLEQSYLLHLMPKFAYSYKSQLVNPRKIYFIDNGLLDAVSVSFSKDRGRKLENMVFWELRRKYTDLYYYNENGHECDFVVFDKNTPVHLIQVCYEIDRQNEVREYNGLFDAMKFFTMTTGTIITFNQEDTLIRNDMRVNVVPAHRFFHKLMS
jgi:predicted AAA+ superfamily ATPase